MLLLNLKGNPYEKLLEEIKLNDLVADDDDKISAIRALISNKLKELIQNENDRKIKISKFKEIINYIAPLIKSKSWHKRFEYYMNSKNGMRELLEN